MTGRIILAFWLGASLSIIACADSVGPDEPTGVNDLKVISTPQPLARQLRVTLNRSDSVEIRYQRDDGYGPTLSIRTLVDGRGTVTLARLAPSVSYTVSVTPMSAGPDAVPMEARFSTDPLPNDLLRLQFQAYGAPTQPLVVLELNRNPGGFEGVVVVDARGAIVWYQRRTTVGAMRRPNGNFVFSVINHGLVEMSPDGTIVTELITEPIHHDVIATPQNTVYYLAYDEKIVGADTIVGEAIWEWDPELGTDSKRWSAWDHLSYEENQGGDSKASDWLHANALAIGPDGNILMSLRFLNQVISIAPDFAAIEWRLGGTNASIIAEGTAEFWGQHTAAELASTGGRRILMFDNGTHLRGFSRALELEIDPDSGTSTKVWEFVPRNLNHSFIVGLARRLTNGNTYVSFGAGPGVLASRGPVEAYEVRQDGTVAWHIQLGGPDVADNFVMYRSWPTGSFAGEMEIDPSDEGDGS